MQSAPTREGTSQQFAGQEKAARKAASSIALSVGSWLAVALKLPESLKHGVEVREDPDNYSDD